MDTTNKHRRKFSERGYQHIFQISSDWGLIFCNIADCVFLYTLLCTRADKYGCKIIACTIMLNHFHVEVKFKSLKDMERYMNDVTNVFARKFNKQYHRKGQVFHRAYGSSPKIRDQKVRDNFIYICNNAKEKKAVMDSREYRWNFLRYYDDAHPFSEKYDPSEASKEMLSLVKKVKCRHQAGQSIDYEFFNSDKYRKLAESEKQQLIDIIISTYNVIDYEPMIQKYGSIDKVYSVLSMIGGGEYDMNDDLEQEDYKHFYKMIKIAKEEGYDMSSERLYGIGHNHGQLSPDIAGVMIQRFRTEAGASASEIRKFLHIDSNDQ